MRQVYFYTNKKATGGMVLLSMNSSLWPFSQNAPVKSISKLVLKPSYTCVGMREIGILNGQFFYTCHILVVRTVARELISHPDQLERSKERLTASYCKEIRHVREQEDGGYRYESGQQDGREGAHERYGSAREESRGRFPHPTA